MNESQQRLKLGKARGTYLSQTIGTNPHVRHTSDEIELEKITVKVTDKSKSNKVNSNITQGQIRINVN